MVLIGPDRLSAQYEQPGGYVGLMVDQETTRRKVVASKSIAIAADDLTGAADTAAVFAGRGWDCRLVLDAALLGPVRPGAVQALDTNSRAAGLAGVDAVARHLGGADVAFLKVDSLLRGGFAADLAALLHGWPRVVFAPAFPARGRSFAGDTARAAVAALTAHGLEPVHLERGHDAGALAREGLLVVEAETDEELRVAAAEHGPTLWVGSAGLAVALASSVDPAPAAPLPPRDRPILTVVGSRTALAQRQAQEALRARNDGAGDRLVSIPRGDGPDDVAAAHELARSLRRVEGDYGALVLVGGDTARAVLTEIGIDELTVLGELEPGTALSVDPSGRAVVTKSGSFGDDGALRRIHERLA